MLLIVDLMIYHSYKSIYFYKVLVAELKEIIKWDSFEDKLYII